jgi:hypothetical protein
MLFSDQNLNEFIELFMEAIEILYGLIEVDDD